MFVKWFRLYSEVSQLLERLFQNVLQVKVNIVALAARRRELELFPDVARVDGVTHLRTDDVIHLQHLGRTVAVVETAG